MGSVVIIVVQPVSICCGAGFVTVVGVSVGPFLGQGSVESFDFAIGLRPVGLGKAMLDAIPQGGLEQAGAVAGTVVGHDCLHGDPSISEERGGALPEGCGGFFAVIGEDLGIGEQRV